MLISSSEDISRSASPAPVQQRGLRRDSREPGGTAALRDARCVHTPAPAQSMPRAPFLPARWGSKGGPQRMSTGWNAGSLVLWKPKRNLFQAGRARGWDGFCFTPLGTVEWKAHFSTEPFYPNNNRMNYVHYILQLISWEDESGIF